jgi:NitT/TauT family transport system substrate-binding protein
MNSRRSFLREATLVGTAGVLGVRPRPAAAEPPLETRRIRIAQVPAICLAAQYVAEELLHGEGFTEVQYVKMPLPQIVKAISAGDIDFSADTAPSVIIALDGDAPLVALAGIHVGCYELVGTERRA